MHVAALSDLYHVALLGWLHQPRLRLIVGEKTGAPEGDGLSVASDWAS